MNLDTSYSYTNDAGLSQVITYSLQSFTSVQNEQMAALEGGDITFDYNCREDHKI